LAVAGNQLPLYELEEARAQLQNFESERLVLHSKKERAEAEAECLQNKMNAELTKTQEDAAAVEATCRAQEEAATAFPPSP
jgi:peptidoglycan hydrolase CwlO-like protein